MESLEGIIVVNKPADWTSHDVVNKMRGIAGTRRVGHLGTLDPIATGVLPVMIGQATRLAQFHEKAEKRYDAVVRFGFATSTYDRAGEPCGPQTEPHLTTRTDRSVSGLHARRDCADAAARFREEGERRSGVQTRAKEHCRGSRAGHRIGVRADAGRTGRRSRAASGALFGWDVHKKHRAPAWFAARLRRAYRFPGTYPVRSIPDRTGTARSKACRH